MLDLTPLTTWHLYGTLGVFVVTYGLLFWEVTWGKQKGATKYPMPSAGLLLIAIVTLATFFAIDSVQLRMGFAVVALLIALIGRSDEIYKLSPKAQFIWQLIIVAILVISGWTIPYVSNPWGEGVIFLDQLRLGTFLIPGSIMAFAWILFFINSINWLDGLDGLAGSVVTIAFGALVAVSLLPSIQDSRTLWLALVGLSTMAAFLIWNFPPAKVFLGTTGSWFMGMYVALVAMQGGGKIVTALLVLALPALDALFVILQRIIRGKKPWEGDTVSHLHHRLLAAGIPPRTIILAATVVTFIFALTSILVPTSSKIGILAILAIGFFVTSVRVVLKERFIKIGRT